MQGNNTPKRAPEMLAKEYGLEIGQAIGKALKVIAARGGLPEDATPEGLLEKLRDGVPFPESVREQVQELTLGWAAEMFTNLFAATDPAETDELDRLLRLWSPDESPHKLAVLLAHIEQTMKSARLDRSERAALKYVRDAIKKSTIN